MPPGGLYHQVRHRAPTNEGYRTQRTPPRTLVREGSHPTLMIMTVRTSGVRRQSIWSGASGVSDDAQKPRSWLLGLGFTQDLLIPGAHDDQFHHCQLDWTEGGRVLLSSTSDRPTRCRPGASSLHVVTSNPDAVVAQAGTLDVTVVGS